MYNLKIEADNILRTLHENGFEAYFVGNYPFVKKNNSINTTEKLKIKSIDIITNATLDDIKSLFTVSSVNTDYYSKFAMVEVFIKQNKINFKIYHAAEYTNIVTGKTRNVTTINEILDGFSFLIDSIMIDIDGNSINYSNKKYSSLDSISSKNLLSNGNFREKLIENPMIIFDLCVHASNIPYSINNTYFKIIGNNKNYIKYIKLSCIQKYMDKILMSKNAFVGLLIIKNNLLDLSYNGSKIFKFLEYCSEQDLMKFSKFNSNVDIISRWAYLFTHVPKESQLELLQCLQLPYEKKIIWLLENFELVNEDNYKLAIYDSKESLGNISNKTDVFLLHEMFQRLTNIWKCLDESKIDICNKIIDAICSRPFFDYQIAYNDEEIYKLIELENKVDLSKGKDIFLKEIIMKSKHPDDEEYLLLLKESILKSLEEN